MGRKLPRIEGWSCTYSDVDPYRAPENRGLSIQGKVYGHPTHRDGNNVLTSFVVRVAGRVIYTRNTTYQLGKVDAKYRKWLRENRPDWDWRDPFKKKEMGK